MTSPTSRCTHFLYLHGFRSSPGSAKALRMARWVAENRPDDLVFACPQLPPSPAEAIALLSDLTKDWPRETTALMGSSLGGFYATVMSERLGNGRTALLNPAVNPARDLAKYIGDQTFWHKPEEHFYFRAEYVDELLAITPGVLAHPQRYCAVIAKGDELLDWREMLGRYEAGKVLLLEGSDHALSDFEDHLPSPDPIPEPLTMKKLQNKVCIVTGAAQGIGLATALKFAREGASVVVCDRRAEGVEAAVEACEAIGSPALGRVLDVTDRVSVDMMVAAVLEQFGRIDVLVNNAGITKDARLQKMTLEQFDAVIDVNLRGVFHCAQAVTDTMINQGSGVILNASSVVGIYGNFGQTNYAAAKFGVIGFTKTWSRELGPKGIRVNAVAPGFIETPILGTVPDKVLEEMRAHVPLKRLGKPEEIANVYAFLASDEASYVNGAVLEVSGGMTV